MFAVTALDRLGIDTLVYTKRESSSNKQNQTADAFGFKWSKRDTYESEAVKEAARCWLLERYCGNDPRLLDDWLAGGRKLILDAGCGAGLSALLLFAGYLTYHDYLGVDISNSVEVAALRFQEAGIKGDFLQANILDLPIPDESVDIIFSEGVLHHTDSTRDAILKLATKLKRAGRFLFYVYAKKALIREFTDDAIRGYLAELSDEVAWEVLMPLTKLGAELGKLQIELDVPDDIPYLGIKAGKIDLQRFFYWNICKAYYRPDYNLAEMNHVNFDWYRPLNCHRHTEKEIRSFCQEAGLEIERFDSQESGFTVIARKI
ncbi:MAG: class I SAM-dependent methyltransferase [Cyanobacteria bacterium NC_groundwater_1444_Ag_S-0.65um_54_12]|nr:class I SAM-dependent methyltransferase [Cyanobacteria bacterium NC_groundwater_1444_Ag_S-0.65um_54_12]